MFVTILIFLIAFQCRIVHSVPPAACNAKFRWEDCGKPPVPVMYYWRPGSRCEVGLWRGCLPNINMFQDEYECVATCIYSSRAGPADFHNLNVDEKIETNEIVDTTTSNTTEDNYTTVVDQSVTNSTEADTTTGPQAPDAGGNNTMYMIK